MVNAHLLTGLGTQQRKCPSVSATASYPEMPDQLPGTMDNESGTNKCEYQLLIHQKVLQLKVLIQMGTDDSFKGLL